MRRIIIWATCCALLLITGYAHAQSSPDAWPIVEHCMGSATKPPADWHFDGTLLLSGFRSYQQDWNTPHISFFDSSQIPSSGLLSPDGHWFAVIKGTREVIGNVVEYKTQDITIFSTQNSEKHTVEWTNTFSAVHRLYGHRLYWLDNQHLLYSKGDFIDDEQWFVINPFTQEVTSWQSKFKPSKFAVIFSPDRSTALHYDQGDEYWTLAQGQDEIHVPILGNIAWSSDSSQFAAYTMKPNTFEVDDIALFDSKGNLIDHIFHISNPNEVFWDVWNANQIWSPDNQYLLFAADHLYLADMTAKKVIDTCIPTRSPTVSWSPESHQFALIDRYVSDRQIQIFDLDRWTRYVVTYHSGSVIGWRSDD